MIFKTLKPPQQINFEVHNAEGVLLPSHFSLLLLERHVFTVKYRVELVLSSWTQSRDV